MTALVGLGIGKGAEHSEVDPANRWSVPTAIYNRSKSSMSKEAQRHDPAPTSLSTLQPRRPMTTNKAMQPSIGSSGNMLPVLSFQLHC